jgi:cytoskeleton protein RodZ
VAKLALTQVEQLQNIGAHLRQVRQEQGLPLEVLANQIFIRPALLHALESGNDAELPEPVFMQCFIRRYAEALGLDGQAISQEFRVTPVDVLPTPERLPTANSNSVVKPETRHSIKVLEQAPSTSMGGSLGGSSRRFPWPLLIGFGALVVLGLGAWGLFGRSSAPSGTLGNSPAPAPEAANAGAADGEAGEATDLEPIDLEASPPLEAPVVVSANLRDRAWLSVVADGSNVYEGVAESGFEETWTAQTSVVFRTGNAGGVELSVNGDRAVVMGNSGVVRTITITPESDVESVESP